MPQTNEIKKVFDEMRSAHESLKEHVDIQIKEVRKNDEASALTIEAVEKINTDLTELRSKYDDLLKASQRPGAAGIGAVDDPEMELRQSAFTKYLRFGAGDTGRGAMTHEEVRALSSSSDVDGGFLVPTTFETEIITNAYNEAELRPLCNVAATGRDTVQLAALSKPVVAWGTRNLAISPQELSAGGERLEIFDLKALTLIANNTLDDSAADIWAELRDMFSMAIAEAEDDAFAIGAGNNSPQGFIADTRVLANYVPTGVAGAIADGSNNGVDALITMLQSLKKTYRRNATWAMNSTSEGEVRKLKDSNGQYLWQPPVQPGNPATLLGRPLVNPEGMPDIAANSFSIALGDFRKGYKVRDRSGVTVQRLVEKYADYDQTGFIVKKRVGGQVILPEAFVLLRTATN